MISIKYFSTLFLLIILSFNSKAQVDNVGTKKVVMDINGSTLKIPYYSNFLLSNVNNGIAKAVIVIHGTNRNADDYFDNMTTAASMRSTETDSLIIIAPQFLTEADIDFHSLDTEHLYWSNGGWKSGSNSKNNLTNPRPERIPSYAVLDTILFRLASNCPNLTSIVFTGHSAGAQVSNRYSASSPIVDILCNQYEISTKFVVANPSSYLYMDNKRRIDGTLDQFEVPTTSCTTYNEWKYGLESLYTYPSTVGSTAIRTMLESSHVNYILGENDNDPNSSSLDTSCEGMLQGNHRLERGTIYFNYLIDYYGNNLLDFQSIDTILGIGHSNFDMYTSSIGLFHLFESYPTSCASMALPIELIGFEASLTDNFKVRLDWKTTSEVNNEYFIIERSKNVINWNTLLRIEATTKPSSSSHYHAYDNNPYTNTIYYRLKQIDFSGLFSYSKVISININELENTFINIYPNPTKSQIIIQGTKEELDNFKVHNILGQNLNASIKIIKKTHTRLTLDVSKLPSGLYFLKTKTKINEIYKQ